MPCSCLCSATRVPQGSRPRAVLRVQQQPARVQDLHRQQGLVAAAAPARRNWRRRAVGRSDSDSVAASDADASDSSSESSSSHLGLVIECDGALIDAHVDGHRVAFNRAFAEIGHDCTNWSPMVRGGEGRSGEEVPPVFEQFAHPPVLLLCLLTAPRTAAARRRSFTT